MTSEYLTPIVIAIVAAIPGILAFIAQWRKAGAETADILTDTATALIVPLREEIKELREQLYDLKVENELLRQWARGMAARLIELGHNPDPEPAVVRPKKARKE